MQDKADLYNLGDKKLPFNIDNIISLLNSTGENRLQLFEDAKTVREKVLGKKVYFRGLIEFSNICAKNCFYCGIRKSNKNPSRYNLSDDEIVDAAIYSWKEGYGSIVLQSGEIASKDFTKRIENLLIKISQATNAGLRVTLSLGEQDYDTYKRWFEKGAQRYLLRIETSNLELYSKIHPDDPNHQFSKRIESLENLRKIGYQTGTGVMIGLPGQNSEHLAKDLKFMHDFGIDMVGMGPYIEHAETPMANLDNGLSLHDRFDLSLKMIALLRLLMPKINIAAATALQSIDKLGREKAIKVGANVVMPNVTPGKFRDSYKLYDNKPCTDEDADQCTNCLSARVSMTGYEVALNEWGDSMYYNARI